MEEAFNAAVTVVLTIFAVGVAVIPILCVAVWMAIHAWKWLVDEWNYLFR